MRLQRGIRLSKYRLEKRLGTGASAEVWLGKDTIEDRKVAIKIILPSVVETFGRESVAHEARVAARLQHPNILSIRNADWVDDYFLIVTDVAQRSLENYAGARRNPELAISIVQDIARGLAYAHSKKVLHRDVKPANILIFPGRQARLSDFGTARFAPTVTRSLTEVGTLGYMAPEHAYGRPRYASDVFSLGLTAYQLLSGKLPSWPFEWPLEGHDVFKRRTPKEIQPVIQKALRVSIHRRWNDAGEFLKALNHALECIQKQKPASPYRKRIKRSSITPVEFERKWFRKQYGKGFNLGFDCYRCDGPISEAMQACPWCGTDRNSFIEITRFPLVCPDCERGVQPEWNACPWCYAGRFISNGKPPLFDQQAERKCTKRGCQGQIRPFMRYCPLCKTKISRPWSVNGISPCPRCRWPLAEHWRYCPWCCKKSKKR